MELLDLYDINRNPLHRTIPRENRDAITEGQRLLVCHLCIFDTKNRLLAQLRQHTKKNYPDCYDLTAGGFVQAGETSLLGILRETKEELGLTFSPADLVFYKTVPFSYVFDDFYLTKTEPALSSLCLQKEEVAAAAWLSEEEVLSGISENRFVDYDPDLIRSLFAAAKTL